MTRALSPDAILQQAWDAQPPEARAAFAAREEALERPWVTQRRGWNERYGALYRLVAGHPLLGHLGAPLGGPAAATAPAALAPHAGNAAAATDDDDDDDVDMGGGGDGGGRHSSGGVGEGGDAPLLTPAPELGAPSPPLQGAVMDDGGAGVAGDEGGPLAADDAGAGDAGGGDGGGWQ